MADANRALFVAGLEAAVVDVYRALLERGSLPTDLVDTVLVLAQHHDEHCAALAAIAATSRAGIAPNDALTAQLEQTVLGADPATAILAVEEQLAATHLGSLGVLEGSDAVAVVVSILPIEARHAVVLDPQHLPAVQSLVGAYDEATYA